MLNAKETNDLIIDIINSDFNNRSNSSCMIIDGIQGGHYNTDLLLASAIRECSHDSLYLVGMLLRLCQKPNIYFKTSNGNMHILCYITYICSKLGKDIHLYQSITLLCLLNGADYTLKNTVNQSVVDFIESYNYPIYNLDDFRGTELFEFLCIYLDVPEECNTELVLEEDKLVMAIKSLAQKCIRKCDMPELVDGENLGIKYCIDSANHIIFREIIDKGIHISYFSMTNLCLTINSDNHNYEHYLEMLFMTIETGVKLDLHQYNLLELNDEKKDIFESIYNQPLWKKLCKLKNSTYNFNLDLLKEYNLKHNNKTNREICERLHELTLEPDNEDIHYDGEHISFKENDKKYTFNEVHFDKLLNKGKNYLTGEELHHEVHQTIKNHESIKRLFGRKTKLHLLNDEHKINNNESVEIKTKVLNRLLLEGVTLERINKQLYNLNAILIKFKCKQDYMHKITDEHQLITFCRCVEKIDEEEEELNNVIIYKYIGKKLLN